LNAPTPSRAARPNERISALLIAGRRWVILAMLLALHAALIADTGGIFQRIWLMVHFGLFLMWQPFYAAERELEVFSLVLLVCIIAMILWFLKGWMLATWLSMLLGIIGGKVFTVEPQRRSRFYLVAFFYLIAMQLAWTVPVVVLGESIPEALGVGVTVFLPVVLALLAFLPLHREENDTMQVFDFFYALLVFQLVVVLVLGSVALMRYTEDQYFTSVILTVLGFGMALFVLAVLWSPRGGFGGLRTYFSLYLLSVGMPFELWMRRVAELAEIEPDARRFVERALAEVASFPWMRGGKWRTPDGAGEFGTPRGIATRVSFHDLSLTFYTGIDLSPALFLHVRLLAQVIAEFHEGKRREQALKQHAYLQAVHETGARLTHDIKNLLQSIYTLTSAAPPAAATEDGYPKLLRSQLPELSKRLQATLDKLRSPELPAAGIGMPAGEWWAGVGRRHAGTGIALSATLPEGGTVPATLFDSVIENCLQNARSKKTREPQISISITLAPGPGGPELTVCDTGSTLPEPVVRDLFLAPIPKSGSANLGIGLFQAYRQARQAGWLLSLVCNVEGRVCFRIARLQDGAEPQDAASASSSPASQDG
jgi:hypothetical protein